MTYIKKMFNYKNVDGGINVFKIIRDSVVLVVIIIVLFSSFGTVGAGERGVKLRFGAVVNSLNEGLYVKFPFIEKVVIMDIKTQKDQTNASAASKDLQTVTSIVALNFHINSEKVSQIYQEIGLNFKERIIDPSIQEAVKSITSKFTAEELITKREIVKDEIKLTLVERLKPSGIVVDEFNIVNFNFSKSFNEAIEAKVTAEQEALASKNRLEQIKYEAEQKIAEAKGKAEAMRIESIALQSNQQILELRALEKWDGKLPQYVGSGSIPFINIK